MIFNFDPWNGKSCTDLSSVLFKTFFVDKTILELAISVALF